MIDFYSCMLVTLTVVVFYAVISRGLFVATDTARQGMVDSAASLLDSSGVPKQEKRCIQISLDEAHSSLAAWKLVVLAFRVAVRELFASRSEAELGCPAHLRGTYETFIRQWLVATLGNSPLASFFFVTVMVLGSAISVPANVFLRAIASRDHHAHA